MNKCEQRAVSMEHGAQSETSEVRWQTTGFTRHYALGTKSRGVRCQVSGVREEKQKG